ncbi:cell division cycle protein 23-like protein [Vairimorpha necatrix]|uniref:Cell division cycle protein 23-like protein n=1 Tax=Vairimorpha necatrix TaxID=6039 RepID=A0AAX4JBS2_9MICR
MNEFFIRGLYRTLDFLNKIKLDLPPMTISYSQSDILYTVYINLKEYSYTYSSLLCTESRLYKNSIFFCTCCNNLKNFMRNYALFLNKKKQNLKIKSEYSDDDFLLYLIGLVKKDINILFEVVKRQPYFWDAYVAIIDLCTDENVPDVDGPLSDYFYMTLFVKKQITKKSFLLKKDFLNLKGAVLYYKREYKEALEVFKKCDEFSDYLDLFSNILYINKDIFLYDVSYKLINMNRYKPETLCCIANTYSFKKNHHKAIEYYNLCTNLLPCSMYFTLLGHEYIELKEYKKAIESYTKSIRLCINDYRGWYSLGKVYELLNMTETSLFYYKKSLEYKKDDTLIWLSLGNVYINLQMYEDGIKCFKQSIKLNDPLGFLYIAETYKTMKMYCESAEYYEKYVCMAKDKDGDVKRICLFLEEYYRKMCDNEKSKKYYEMSREID